MNGKPCETCGLPMTDEESEALYAEVGRLKHNTKVDWAFIEWIVGQSDYASMDAAWAMFLEHRRNNNVI